MRIEACNAAWEARSKQKKPSAAKKASVSSSSTNAWTTAPVISRGKLKAPSGTSTKKKTGTASGGGVFGAMMMDSDSD